MIRRLTHWPCLDHLTLATGLGTLSFGNAVLLPVLVPVTLGLGMGEEAAGVILSIGAALVPFSAPFWGRQADRIGPRAIFVLGVSGGALSFLLMAVALVFARAGALGTGAIFVMLCLARVVYGGLASAALPAAIGFLAKGPAEQRTRALALPGMAFTLGALAGSSLALPLVPLAGPIAPLFAVGGLGLVATALAARLPRAGGGSSAPAQGPGQPRAVLFATASAITALAMLHGILPLLLAARGQLTTEATVQAAALAGLAATVATLLGLRHAGGSRHPPQHTALLGLAVITLGALLQWQAGIGLAASIACNAAIALGAGMVTPALQAIVSLDAARQGEAAGTLSAATALGWIIGPALGLSLYGRIGASVCLLAILLCLPLAGWLAHRMRRTPC